MSFENAWLLFLLWLVPAVAAWWYAMHRMHERALARFLSAIMQKKLRPPGRRYLFAWQAALVTAGLFLLVIAAARPQWGSREETVYQRGRDLLIALDVSRSMLARDVHPNRLERAKTDIMDLVRELRGDRAGLMAFRRKAVLLCPLTTDYAYLRQALDAVSIDSAPRGQTDIGTAIETALDSFDSDTGSHKAIVLVSDGEDLSGRAGEMAAKAAERGIPIFTVGLGSTRGAPVPGEKEGTLKHEGKEVLTRLENETLYKIAEATRGAYVPIGTAGATTTTLGTIYRKHLQKIAAKEQEETLHRRAIERYQWFLFPGLLLLTAGALLSRGRFKTGQPAAAPPRGTATGLQRLQRQQCGQVLPMSPPLRTQAGSLGPTGIRNINPPRSAPRNIAAALALLLAGAPCIEAQTDRVADTATNVTVQAPSIPSGRAGARKAQTLYARGRYEDAAAAYLAAARDTGARSRHDYRYNAAVSHFKAGRYEEALDLLRDLMLADGNGTVDAATALGGAAYRVARELGTETASNLAARAELLQEAGDAFREAARAAPTDQAAVRNAAVLQKNLPEAREKARVAGLLEQYREKSASRIAAEMLTSQQRLIAEIPAAFTNNTPTRIDLLEALSARQRANADLWIPLKGKLLQAFAQRGGDADQQQLAAVNELAEQTRDNMLGGAGYLRDLDPAAYGPAVSSQAAIYGLWKSIAAYPEILREDLHRQSNALTATVAAELQAQPGRPSPVQNQAEAVELTRLFVDRFTAAVPDQGTNAPPPAPLQPDAPTNAAAIAPETRARILELADQAEAAQAQALTFLESSDTRQAAGRQTEAHALLKEIEDLLPKQQQQQQQNQQPQQDQQRQDQQDQQQEPEEQPPQPEPPEPKPEEQEPQPEEQDLPDDVQQLLDKALQREKEHEEEKRRRDRFVPLPTLERDW